MLLVNASDSCQSSASRCQHTACTPFVLLLLLSLVQPQSLPLESLMQQAVHAYASVPALLQSARPARHNTEAARRTAGPPLRLPMHTRCMLNDAPTTLQLRA